MLEDLLSGGLVGALGRLGQAGLDFYQKREDRKARIVEERETREHDLRKQDRELEHALKVGKMTEAGKKFLAQTQLASTSSQEYSKTLAALHEAEAKIGASYPWVNAVRAMVRPVLIFISLLAVIAFGAAEVENSHTKLLAQLLMMAATYYFMDRTVFKNSHLN